MKRKKEPGANRIPQVAAGLLCLVLLSAWALSGLMARFVTSAEGGDAANVASFSITDGTATETANITLHPGSGTDETAKETFAVKISNNSEVAVKYTISMDLLGNLPISVAADSQSALTQEEGKLVWTTTTAAQAEESTYTFYPVWDADKNDYRYSTGVESIQVTVTAEQED